ncbi:MAG: DUF1298 domain-containing protein, partial [Myxococcales bacterium]|nr:DUF1298 domain-containing protein [Myxococcales bacterium]
VMSYQGSIDFGFMVAADSMPDVWDLADQVEPAYLELIEAAQKRAEDLAQDAMIAAQKASAKARSALEVAASVGQVAKELGVAAPEDELANQEGDDAQADA